MRSLRSRGVSTLAVTGVLMAFVFSALAPAHASSPSPLPGPPGLTLTAPNGGESLTGGNVFLIRWSMSHPPDTDLFVTLSFSYDGGSQYYFLTGAYFMTGTAAFLWYVPAYATPAGRVRVCAEARDGSAGCVSSASNFSITMPSPPPILTLLSPANYGTEVPLNATIGITAQGLDPARVMWQMIPTVAFTYTWTNNYSLLWLTPVQPMPACAWAQLSVWGYDLAGIPVGPTNWTFRTQCFHPVILSTSPAGGSTGVPVDASVVLVFSEPMNRSTVVVTISPLISLTHTWSTGDTVLTLTHTMPFPACAAVTLTVDGRSKVGHWLDAGNASNPWTFYTVCSAPYIVSTSPNDGDSGVPPDAQVHIAFSMPMNTQTVVVDVNPPFQLNQQWDPNSTTSLWLTHYTNPFPSCTQFTLTVSGSDVNGNPLVAGPVPNPFNFTTCPPVILATNPADGAQGVNLDSPIVVTFSEPMNRSSLLYTFWWSGPPPIGFNITWWQNDTVATFTHTDPLPLCTLIQAIIDANDTDGNPLIPGPVPNPWSFTTGCGPTTLVLSSPVGGESWTGGSPHDVVLSISDPGGVNRTSEYDLPIRQDQNGYFNSSFIRPVTLVNAAGMIVDIAGRPGTDLDLYISRDNGDSIFASPDTLICASASGLPFESCGMSYPTDGLYFIAVYGWGVPGGNSTFNMTITIWNVPTAFDVSASYRSAAGAGPIGSQVVTVPPGATVQARIPWRAPSIDATDVVVNVTAVSSAATLWAESAPFEIDSTPPIVVAASPMGSRTPVDPYVVVSFSEAMALPAGNPLTIAPAVAMTVTWAPLRDGFTASLGGTQPCTTYTVTLGPMRDDSDPGNALRLGPVPNPWTFTTVCLPSVTLLAPNGGEDWTGGSVHTISWSSTDQDSPVLSADLAYSTDDGATWTAIALGLSVPVGPGSYAWTLPTIDSSQALVRIVVTDPEGNAASDASDAPFTIDSTPPSLLASYPSDGQAGFKTTRDVWFVWSERVDRASFEASFSMSPNPGGIAFSWIVSNLGGDVLIVAHAPFKSNTAYAVTFGTAAKDDSDPGNPLPAALTVRFNTQPPPNVNPPVAKAVGKSQVQVDEVVTLDGRASTGNIVSYVWRIVDNQGRFYGIALGAETTFVFRDHGRYSVTLLVTDANGASDEDTIEIAVTSNENGNLILAGSVAMFVGLALVASTEAGKLGLFSLFVFPLYVRRKKNEVLEHQTRGMILGYVLVHPGDSYTDIRRNLMLSNGTLSYHLTVLEREGLIQSRTQGTRKRFYTKEARAPEDGGGLHEVQIRMYRAIREVPGLAVKDLAGILGITSQHTLYHLRGLATQGYVRLERQGFYLRAYPVEGPEPPLSRPEE